VTAPSEEIYGKSTQGTRLKIHSLGYKLTTLSLTKYYFIRLAVVASQICEIFRRFVLAVQGYPRSSILVSIESSYATSY